MKSVPPGQISGYHTPGGQEMKKVEDFEQIRKAYQIEGLATERSAVSLLIYQVAGLYFFIPENS
jgi:hypothetical protein